MSDAEKKLPEVSARTDGWWQRGKTFAIWFVLVLLFSSIYSMFDSSGSGSWGTTGWVVLGGIVLVAFVIGVIWQTKVFRRQHAAHDKGIEALARGELEIARQTFWQCAETTRSPMLAALASHNLAWVLMRQGAIRQAVEVLENNLRLFSTQLHAVRMHAMSEVDLALDQALLGELDAAEQSFVRADASAAKGRVPPFSAMRALTRAVIDCRAGRQEAAAKALADGWAELEVASPGEVMRLLRVVRAFARTAAGPREAGAAAAHLDGMRPAYHGEFDFLGSAWPEMEQFLVSHQLTRAKASEESALAST